MDGKCTHSAHHPGFYWTEHHDVTKSIKCYVTTIAYFAIVNNIIIPHKGGLIAFSYLSECFLFHLP